MAWRTTASADVDIAAIESYGALNFGRRRAQIYLDDLFSVLELISANPRIARERSELASRARLYSFRSHSIFYTIEGEDILILRVLGNRQDWSHL